MMQVRVSWQRYGGLSGAFAVGLSLLSACGGRSSDDDYPNHGGSGAGGRGTGSTSSGSASSGSASSGGGTSAGGVSAGGSAIGGANTGGFGAISSAGGNSGSGGSNCMVPQTYECDPGNPYWVFFDEASGQCRSAAGVCFATDPSSGVFASLQECLSICVGSKPSEDVCDRDTDCKLSHGCCAPCPPVKVSDLRAVRVDAEQGACPPVLCGPCPNVSEVEQNQDYFWPVCRNHTCSVVDLTQGPAGACEQPSDCFLRNGTGCCDGCDYGGFVPLSNTDYLTGLCDDVGCPDCISPPPTNVAASCDLTTKQCVKEELFPVEE